jgi:hypothetical protein
LEASAVSQGPAESNVWVEQQIAPMLLGLVVSIATQRIGSLNWAAQLAIAAGVGLGWWWLMRTRLHRRRAAHPEVIVPSVESGAAEERKVAEPPSPAQPPGPPSEPPRPAPGGGTRLGSGRRPLLVALLLAILLGILATLLHGTAVVTTLAMAGWLLLLVALPTLARSLPAALQAAASQVAAVSVGAAVGIAGQAAGVGLLFPTDRLDGSWQVDQATVVSNTGIVGPQVAPPAMRWTLAGRGSCPRSPCRYDLEGEDLPPTGQSFRFTLTLTADGEYRYAYDTVADCVETESPTTVTAARGYRVHAVYQVRPVAWAGPPGSRRPTRLRVKWTEVARATKEALAQHCTDPNSAVTLANASRAANGRLS